MLFRSGGDEGNFLLSYYEIVPLCLGREGLLPQWDHYMQFFLLNHDFRQCLSLCMMYACPIAWHNGKGPSRKHPASGHLPSCSLWNKGHNSWVPCICQTGPILHQARRAIKNMPMGGGWGNNFKQVIFKNVYYIFIAYNIVYHF